VRNLSPLVRDALCSLAIVAALGAPNAARADVRIDPNHTSATFSVKHLTLTTVSGKIALKDAAIAIAADDTLTSAHADLDLSTIDTQVADRDDDLKSDHWFDVAKYPTMTFESTKITGDRSALTVVGDLTFHGKTNPVILTAKYEGSIKDPRGRTHIGYTATGVIDRSLWDLGPNFPTAVVANEITITIELEAIVT
jgi:polyisoprenoid-binding protein YceI